MNITREVKLLGRVYRAEVSISDLTELERLRLQQFGDVTVHLGGAFTYGIADTVFTLPTNDRRIPRESTFVQTFQLDGNADAALQADAWAVEVQGLIVDALNTLVALSPGPIGRVVTSYNLPLA
jgi:hypothetical protein